MTRKPQSRLEHQLGWKLRLEHLFACDIEPVSQVFVAQNTRPHALFENLRNRGEMGHCLIADAPVVVPNDLDIYVAGFPCKDFSMLNSNRPCLEGPHAETFHGVVNYIRQHKPATYVLENVVGLLSKCLSHNSFPSNRTIPQPKRGPLLWFEAGGDINCRVFFWGGSGCGAFLVGDLGV